MKKKRNDTDSNDNNSNCANNKNNGNDNRSINRTITVIDIHSANM